MERLHTYIHTLIGHTQTQVEVSFKIIKNWWMRCQYIRNNGPSGIGHIIQKLLRYDYVVFLFKGLETPQATVSWTIHTGGVSFIQVFGIIATLACCCSSRSFNAVN